MKRGPVGAEYFWAADFSSEKPAAWVLVIWFILMLLSTMILWIL